jgi:hypothetical protein
MFKSNFTDAEWQTVLFAPLWAFHAVAGADRKVDPKEGAALAKELTEAALYKDDFAREVLGALASGIATIMPAYAADRRSVVEGLREAAQILDAKMTAGGADGLKKAIFLVCLSTARAAGPIFGGKVSKEERATIALVATILHIPVPTA